MKVLTAAEMREVDRLTIERGIPGIVLMENAGSRVVEFLARHFAPLSERRIVVLCGKGNNGGDGLVIARQLFTRFQPSSLDVVLASDPAEMRGDAAANVRMLSACGCPHARAIAPSMRNADLVIDALLGTGLNGAASGAMLDAIREINSGFPLASVVAVDIPSGLPSDSPHPTGEFARAGYTVTFTAPKIAHALAPNCDRMGELLVAPIGSPAELYDGASLELLEPSHFADLLAPRDRGGHKGDYGHALIVGGAPGKAGAAAMAGLAALRAGAGLVTVACSELNLMDVAPELMTAPLAAAREALTRKDVVAIGPGLGSAPELAELARSLVAESGLPLVVDADALNALAAAPWRTNGKLRVLTPHPGEMSRLTAKPVAEIEADRVGAARAFAKERNVVLVLKGYRTLIASPDGRVQINPTGTPAMGTGGTGDILTGLIAGLLAQFPERAGQAIGAAVYLHGLAGQIGAASRGEKALIATDLLEFLPAAMHACANPSDRI